MPGSAETEPPAAGSGTGTGSEPGDAGGEDPDAPTEPEPGDAGGEDPDAPTEPEPGDAGGEDPDAPTEPEPGDAGGEDPDAPTEPEPGDAGGEDPDAPTEPEPGDAGAGSGTEYVAADVDEILRRWRGFTVAPVAGVGQSLRAASSLTRGPPARQTVTISSLTRDQPRQTVTITDARRYGACEVFTMELRSSSNETSASEYYHFHIAVMDCVDRAKEEPGDHHAGDYHVAAIWQRYQPQETTSWYVLIKASDRSRSDKLITIDSGRVDLMNGVSATLGGEEAGYWYLDASVADGFWGGRAIEWKDKAVHDRFTEAVAQGSGSLTFTLSYDPDPDNGDDADVVVDAGTLVFESSDAAAAAAYTARTKTVPYSCYNADITYDRCD